MNNSYNNEITTVIALEALERLTPYGPGSPDLTQWEGLATRLIIVQYIAEHMTVPG